MDDTKVFEAFYELPEGYQAQLMVLRDFPGGRQRRGLRMNIYRSRVWIGHVSEAEPLVHRSQEHSDLRVAIDACFSLLLGCAPMAVDSPAALGSIQDQVHYYFHGVSEAATN